MHITVGGRRPIDVDRAALVTLLHELGAERPNAPKTFATNENIRDLRYALHGQQLDAYLAVIAKDAPEEARALWVHLCSPYDIPEENHILGRLFPKPLALAKELNVASSAGALVARALPYAAKTAGSLVDRVAAIRIVTMMLIDIVMHRKVEELLTDAGRVATSLGEETSALLRECGWLLDAQIQRCRKARVAV